MSSLTVAPHPQEAQNWCWAASAQMVLEYLGHSQSQCHQVNDRLQRTDCSCSLCSPGGGQDPACDMPNWPDFDKYGFTSDQTRDAPLSWDELRVQLSREKNCKKTPFLVTWRHRGGGGHMVVATGYKTIDGVNYVDLLDPWLPCLGDVRTIPYEEYVENEFDKHWIDFYNIRPKGK
jgi:hypothetical protein